MRRRGSKSAFTLAALAAGLALILSVAGTGSRALAAVDGLGLGLARDAGDGHGAPPFVARHDTAPPRAALPANRRSADQPSTLAAVLPEATALSAPTSAVAQTHRPAAPSAGRTSDLPRTSRGPPAR